MNLSGLISKFNALRPWQLLALTLAALGLGGVIFALLPGDPNSPADPVTAMYKAWLMCGFACLGLIIDMVVFYYGRPGNFRSPWTDSWPPELRALFVHAMYRRALVIGVTMLAGGLAL